MNLDKYSTKESLEALVQNKDEFLKVVNESTGFILDMLKNHNVKPELNMLIENLSVFTIQYITDNYQLNSKQSEKIAIFVSDEETVFNKKLKPEEVDEYLINKKSLPRGTDLSLEQINKYYKEIEEQFKMDDDATENNLINSFRKFSMDDAYKLERQFLLKNPYVLTSKPAFFHDPNYREFYKEIALKAYKKPEIRHFRSYVFTPTDKDFLIQLLENTEMRSWRNEYAEYTNIPGFTSLVNKYEFFEKFNSGDIEHFSDAEVENNVDLFKRVYLSDTEDRSHYRAFAHFLNKKMSLKKFKVIFDEEFVETYINNLTKDATIDKFFDYHDAEHDKSVIDKQAHLSRIVAGLCAEDKILENGKSVSDVVSIREVFGFRKDVQNLRNSPFDEQATDLDKKKIEEYCHTIFNNILPKHLKNENFSTLEHDSQYIFDPFTIKLASEFFQNNVNVNNFFIISSIYKNNREKHFHDYSKREFMEYVNHYMTTMHDALVERNNSDELASIVMILNGLKKYEKNRNDENKEDKFIKQLLKKTPKHKAINNPDEHNFLAFETNGVEKLSMWEKVYSIRPQLVNYVLKNNIIPPENFIKHCLYNIELKKNVDFLKAFAQKHREYIEQNDSLLAAYLASSRQVEIFPLTNTDKIEVYFQEAIALIHRKNMADANQEIVRSLYPREDMPYSFEDGKYPQIDMDKFDENIEISKDLSKKEAKTLYLYLYTKEHLLGKQLEDKGNLIPYSFMVEKLEDYVKKKDFKTILTIDKARIKYSHTPFINYVNNISFEELKNNLDDTAFFKLLKESLKSDNKTEIVLPKFSYEQNMELANIFLDKYKKNKNDNSDDEEFKYSYEFLYFFAEENRDFVKEFAIEKFPKEMFYGYDFRPQGSDSFRDRKLVTTTYSNEELYRAFLNLEEKGDGFLSHRGVNADYKNLFEPVFFPEGRRNENPTDDRYKDFLNFVKDKSPMLYLLVANASIYSPMLDYGKRYGDDDRPEPKYRSRDEAEHGYFLETFDMDTILKGVEVVIDKMATPKLDKYHQDVMNKELASYAISRMVMQTYYEVYDTRGYGNNTYESKLSHEDTIKLMKLLFTKSPEHFIERHRIGQAINPVEFFKANIDEFYSFENVKSFIFPNSEVHCKDFYLDDRYGNTNQMRLRLIEFTKTIIETAVKKDDKQVIDFLAHAVSQHQFIKKEMKNNHRYAAYPGINDALINAISKDATINSLLGKTKLNMDLNNSLEVNAPVKKKNKL